MVRKVAGRKTGNSFTWQRDVVLNRDTFMGTSTLDGTEQPAFEAHAVSVNELTRERAPAAAGTGQAGLALLELVAGARALPRLEVEFCTFQDGATFAESASERLEARRHAL